MSAPSQLSLFDVDRPPAPVEKPATAPTLSNLRADAGRLARDLSHRLGIDVRLAITDNRSTLISFRRRPHAIVVRVHHMFLTAPEPIIAALAAYTGHGDREAGPILDRFIRQHRETLRPSTRPRTLKARGLFHDLDAIFAQLNARHFDGQIDAQISWGRLTTKAKGHRSIRMGVYLGEERLIRIHPALDRPEVPSYFVAFVVFHEMLHQAVPAESDGGRSRHHGPQFRRRERAYPDYELAIAWEKAHLHQLLGFKRPPDYELD